MNTLVTGFSSALFTHVANDTRVTKNQLEAAYKAWRAAKERAEEVNEMQSQYYTMTIDIPRNERKEAYDAYLRNKLEMWSQLDRVNTYTDKRSIVRNIVLIKLPDILKDGVESSSIYTKNIQVL